MPLVSPRLSQATVLHWTTNFKESIKLPSPLGRRPWKWSSWTRAPLFNGTLWIYSARATLVDTSLLVQMKGRCAMIISLQTILTTMNIQSVLVGGPYLVRTANIDGETLALVRYPKLVKYHKILIYLRRVISMVPQMWRWSHQAQSPRLPGMENRKNWRKRFATR